MNALCVNLTKSSFAQYMVTHSRTIRGATGDNMADAVWKTMVKYGLIGKVYSTFHAKAFVHSEF